ncbi:hypothetical protein ACGFNU_49970 [Spirillospora sp. NPDC048911]|uniref:hypothetical protein n=1 Tax=Spirillospora sp. NPDC048911 TaxID=3364527 RepID=UPI003716EFAF
MPSGLNRLQDAPVRCMIRPSSGGVWDAPEGPEHPKATGQPWCRACKQRWATCSQCGELAPIRGGTRAAPLCARRTRPDETFWKSCATCGRADRINAGRCVRCAVEQRLRAELGDASGQIDPRFDKLFAALTSSTRPTTVDRWLNRSAAPRILRALDDTDLTHQALDGLPAGKAVQHLRSVLVAIGVLEPRDEQMVRLESWMTTAITARPDPDEQHLLRRYAIWHVLRRLRRRTVAGETTHNQLSTARQQVRAAIVVLDWLTAHDLTLATCTQKDLEAWITSDEATHRREAGHFIRWATSQKLTDLTFPATKWGGPQQALDAENRWEQARRLLHDDAVKLEDRVAGLLVLLYAQWPSAISRLTLNHLDLHGDQVKLHLGREPLTLPEPLAGLTTQLAATRRGHAAIGHQEASPWLFPGGQPGRPISAAQLTERLRQIGIQPGRARSTALFQLATDLPAALLARLLGIHISVAVAWQRASAGDWTSYAAEISRRKATADE